jgi:tetratricopeptide (TPR) repeat protein
VAKHKIGKKELKQPDQFVGFWTRASERASSYVSSHVRALVIGASALATVVIGSVVISQVAETRAVRASEALDRVHRIAAADLTTAGTPPKDDGVPHFATEKERLEGALKELDGYFKSPRTPLFAEATLVRGGLLLDLDRADEAADVYGKLLGDRLDARLRFLAREGEGYAFEKKGKLDEAQAAFAKLGSDAESMDGFYKDRAQYHQARLAELRGNPTEATRIYHEVLEKNPTTSLRDEITNRLAVLELK